MDVQTSNYSKRAAGRGQYMRRLPAQALSSSLLLLPPPGPELPYMKTAACRAVWVAQPSLMNARYGLTAKRPPLLPRVSTAGTGPRAGYTHTHSLTTDECINLHLARGVHAERARGRRAAVRQQVARREEQPRRLAGALYHRDSRVDGRRSHRHAAAPAAAPAADAAAADASGGGQQDAVGRAQRRLAHVLEPGGGGDQRLRSQDELR